MKNSAKSALIAATTLFVMSDMIHAKGDPYCSNAGRNAYISNNVFSNTVNIDLINNNFSVFESRGVYNQFSAEGISDRFCSANDVPAITTKDENLFFYWPKKFTCENKNNGNAAVVISYVFSAALYKAGDTLEDVNVFYWPEKARRAAMDYCAGN